MRVHFLFLLLIITVKSSYNIVDGRVRVPSSCSERSYIATAIIYDRQTATEFSCLLNMYNYENEFAATRNVALIIRPILERLRITQSSFVITEIQLVLRISQYTFIITRLCYYPYFRFNFQLTKGSIYHTYKCFSCCKFV